MNIVTNSGSSVSSSCSRYAVRRIDLLRRDSIPTYTTIIITTINNNNNLLVEWKDSRWLVLSSTLFGLPSIYGFQKRAVLHFTLLVITSGVSVGYWVCANHSWRRNLDICVSNTSTVVFLVSGIYKIHTVYVCMFYPGCLGFLYMYYILVNYYRKKIL